MDHDLISTESDTEFVQRGVDYLIQKIESAIAAHGSCIIGLSGGSTPKAVYEALGEELIDWELVKVFLVDERYIAADHEDSNQKLVRDTLLLHADIPEENLIFPDTTLPLDVCVAGYTKQLIALFSAQPPDVLTLGLGEDGHTASLFPPVPEHAFGEMLALHTTTDQFAVRDRITVSPLVIMAAQAHILMIKGEGKKRVFDEMMSTEQPDPSRWPLHVALATGRTTVLLGE